VAESPVKVQSPRAHTPVAPFTLNLSSTKIPLLDVCPLAGVETVAEIHDWVNSDLRKAFPEVAAHVNIQLVEALPHILSMFEADLIDFVEKNLKSQKI